MESRPHFCCIIKSAISILSIPEAPKVWQLGWMKTYDAEYVALARMARCRLFTVDARLRRGAGHVVQIIGPGDL